MEEYLTIFDDIYYIKDDIPDEVYLSLNNKVMKLLQELKECKNKLNYIDERSYSSGSAIDDEYDEEYYDENEELSNIDPKPKENNRYRHFINVRKIWMTKTIIDLKKNFLYHPVKNIELHEKSRIK